MKLFSLPITEEQCKLYFPDASEKGTPEVKISTYSKAGKKTVLALWIEIVRVEQCDGYAMEYSYFTSGFTKIPLLEPIPTSRKNFKEVVNAHLKAWQSETTLPIEHPHRQAVTAYLEQSK